MVRWLLQLVKNIWIGSSAIEIESSFSIDESVERLSAFTRRSAVSSMANQDAVGTVKRNRVSLQRKIPRVANPYKPFFCGKFVEREGTVFLVGKFVIHWGMRVVLFVWFGFMFLWTIGVTLLAVLDPNVSFIFALAGPAMIAGGCAMVSSGRAQSQHDAAWLTNLINYSLVAK